MRSRFITSLFTLFILCCVAASASRAQEAPSQSPTKPKKKPAATSTQAAKKPAAASQTAKVTATKKPATQAATAKKPAAKTKQDAASGNVAAKRDEASAVAAKKKTALRARADKKAAAGAGDTPKAPSEKATTETKAATDATKHVTEKKAATNDDAASHTPAPNPDATKTDATPATKAGAASKTAKPQAAKGQKKATTDKQDAPAVVFDPAKEAELKAKLEEILKLPAWERITELQDFLDQALPDALADRAAEHLVSAQAAYGDERLQAGDINRGVALFQQAVADASEDVSDKLYFEVVSQLPANLVLRGQPAAAFELARKIEPAAKGDAKRLLALAAFYLTAEHTDDAARLAARAVKLAPDLAAAHQALAAADRLSLRLDESVAEYARAAELDPKSTPARHSLADMSRATGKPAEALAIYRELLAADSTDRAARDGVVLSLFDAGRRAEAERELEAALKDDPRDLQLLAGAAYWYAAHGDEKRALELSGQAVQLEPRHPWAQVALARSLVANNLASDAERSLRFARLYSHFPTLDYELASALAAAGLYAEAADELARSFTIKGDGIETQLAGRVNARAPNFVELLAPERRASFFAHDAADTDANALSLKGLLALQLALKSAGTKEQSAAVESAAATAAKEFAAGDDSMRAFRQLYAADRLLRRGVAPRTALELVEAAKGGVDAGLDTRQATIAVNADELRDVRADAIAQGGTPSIPDLPRGVLDNLMRGHIEELTGWALLDQGKSAEAVTALRRAVGVLPEESPYWRNALWRLGTALAANGERQEALNAYVKSYDRDEPDAARRAVIEALYRKLNGTLSGLDMLLGSAPLRARPAAPAATSPQRTTVETAQAGATKPDATKIETTKPDATNVVSPKIEPAPMPTPDAAPPKPEATPETKPAERSDADAKRDDAKRDETKPDEPKVVEAKNTEKKNTETTQPPNSTDATAAPTTAAALTPTPTPEPAATPTPAAPSTETQTERKKVGACALSLNSDALTLDGGGSASVVATFDGEGDIAKITATTPNWSDIIVLREPTSASGANAAKFTVTSISKSSGSFAVTIKSPCGAKQLSVTVK
ncbi:MAG: hypothetical protein QOF61_669 [Acidobacteriota bacterium]|nr:hypothetical protein [Acidobacteriota bacterium]